MQSQQRPAGHGTGEENRRRREGGKEAVRPGNHLRRIRRPRFDPSQGVITSYSIHYTKLYDYNASGEQIGVEYRSSGKVTGISFDSGTAQLVLDNYVGVDVGSVVGVL